MTKLRTLDIGRLQQAPRCGAKTRQGVPCKAPAVNGKKRCRMHGGAKGSGAPFGNRNAYKHGLYGKETMKRVAELKRLMSRAKTIV